MFRLPVLLLVRLVLVLLFLLSHPSHLEFLFLRRLLLLPSPLIPCGVEK